MITCALALLQVHIFWVTLFHHHDSLPLPLQSSTVQQGSADMPLEVEASLFCTACQIMRHSAAQPALAFQLPAPATLVPFLPKGVLIKIHSIQPDAFNGRAPPLFS